jgi:hypothetical protein
MPTELRELIDLLYDKVQEHSEQDIVLCVKYGDNPAMVIDNVASREYTNSAIIEFAAQVQSSNDMEDILLNANPDDLVL